MPDVDDARGGTLVAVTASTSTEPQARGRVASGQPRCRKHALVRAAASRGRVGITPLSFRRSRWGKRCLPAPRRVGVEGYYDPTTGTFLTRDPLGGDPAGKTTTANPYAYGYNDPLNKVDPLGLRPCDMEFTVNGKKLSCDDIADAYVDAVSSELQFSFLFPLVNVDPALSCAVTGVPRAVHPTLWRAARRTSFTT